MLGLQKEKRRIPPLNFLMEGTPIRFSSAPARSAEKRDTPTKPHTPFFSESSRRLINNNRMGTRQLA